MNTLETIKKAGWAEVEQLQRELLGEKRLYSGMCQIEMLSHAGNQMRERINIMTGKIQGMVFILNMIR